MYNQKELLAFLCERDGRCRQLVNNVVQSLSTARPLPELFMGWEEISLFWERALTGYLTVRAFTLPLGMIGEGARILRNDRYKFNIDRELYLQLYELNEYIEGAQFYSRYDFLYKGQLDFSNSIDKKGTGVFEINILEASIKKIIKAQESTKFKIPMDGDAKSILFDGITMHKSVSWTVPQGFEIGSETTIDFLLPLVELGRDGVTAAVYTNDQQFETFGGSRIDFLATSPNDWIGVSEYFPTEQTINIGGIINIRCLEGLEFVFGELQIDIFRNTFLPDGNGNAWMNGDGMIPPDPGFFASRLARIPIGNMEAGKTYQYKWQGSGILQPGERAFITGRLFKFVGVAENIKIRFEEGTEIKASYAVRNTSSYVLAMRAKDVFRKLLLKIGVPANAIQSDLLENSKIFFTSGDTIRGLADTFLTISYVDFCKGMDVVEFGSYGVVNEKARFESRLFAFTPSKFLPLGEFKEGAEITPEREFIGARIKIGHQEQNVDDANSKYGFAGVSVYKTPEQAIPDKEIDLQSPFKACCFEMEEVRINLEGKETTSKDTDLDVYVIEGKVDVNVEHYDFDGSFQEDLQVIYVDIDMQIVKGQKIYYKSALNEGTATVLYTANLFLFAKIVVIDQPVIEEANVPIHIDVLTGAVYQFDRTEIPDSGVPSPETVFNVSLRNSKLFEKHMRWFRSTLYNFEPGKIEFISNNINDKLVVSGKADNRHFPIAEMGERIFLPFVIEGEPETPANIVEEMETDANLGYTCIIDGRQYECFNLKTGIAILSKKTQQYKLLLTANNNVENLI